MVVSIINTYKNLFSYDKFSYSTSVYTNIFVYNYLATLVWVEYAESLLIYAWEQLTLPYYLALALASHDICMIEIQAS